MQTHPSYRLSALFNGPQARGKCVNGQTKSCCVKGCVGFIIGPNRNPPSLVVTEIRIFEKYLNLAGKCNRQFFVS